MYKLLALLNETWKDILPLSNGLSWSQDVDNLAMELSFESLVYFKEGTFISMTNGKNEFFRGITIKKNTKKKTNSYTVMDYMWYLNKSEEIIQFNKISAKKAIEQLCSREGISCSIANMNTNIKKIYVGQTIASIIEDILDQVEVETGIKYTKYMNKSIFTIEKLSEKKIRAKLLIADDMSLESSIEDMKNSIIVVSSEGENANILATAKDQNSINKIGKLQQVISVDKKNYSQAKQIANNNLNVKNKSKNTLPISCIALENGEDIKPNCYLYFYFPAQFGGEGWYFIKSVSHSLSNNNHYINLVLEW